MTLEELFWEILQRPRMFVPKSLTCVKSFLDGWCHAQQHNVDAAILEEFESWVRTQVGVQDPKYRWHELILLRSQDEAAAVDRCRRWFSEFLEQRVGGGD